ncbi:MAG: nitroreductase family deazaflavin-dependent oxidoreductase [Acidimicrobiia bacterium]
MIIISGDLDRHEVCDVTTVGRVTGRPHRIEIWFAHDNGTMYLLSGGSDRSDWVRNLIANPAVTVDIAGASFSGRGRVVEGGTDEDRLARDLVFAKYTPNYAGDLTEWRDTALPVAIDLQV